MKVFLDANVLVSVLNKEYPVFTYSSRLMSLADQPSVQLYTSPICLAIAFYFSEKKSGTKQARIKTGIMVEKLKITTVDEETVRNTSFNKKNHDFEDGLQYYSAVYSQCDFLVSENTKDFYFAEALKVCNSRSFMEAYTSKKYPL